MSISWQMQISLGANFTFAVYSLVIENEIYLLLLKRKKISVELLQ